MNQHTRRHIHLGLRYSSKLPGIPMGDMFTVVIAKSAWHAVGEQIGSLLTFINKTYSETGQVKLASRDWRSEPTVEFNLLSDKPDLDRLMSGFKLMAAVQMTDAVREVTDTPFPAAYSDKVRAIGVVNTKNKILTSVVAQMLDGPAALRRYIIDKFVVERLAAQGTPASRSSVQRWIRAGHVTLAGRAASASAWHIS